MYGHEQESELKKIALKAFMERREKDTYVTVERSKLKKLIRIAKKVEHSPDSGLIACSSPTLGPSCDCWVGPYQKKINKLVKEMGIKL